MEQLAQKLKNGEMRILEVAAPLLDDGMILVRNHYSLISAGTEGSTVTAARKSLLGKAKDKPQQVKQVIDSLKQQGPLQTYRAVMKKLDSYSPLGYSTAGEVIEVGADVHGFSVGDLVACAGAGYANHAEIVAVPSNLCVKLPNAADLSKAAYNTLGAIALQGIRQADLRLGETCVVIGLGLLGQLTCLMLRASGVRVIGTDIGQAVVDLAAKHCADAAFVNHTPGLSEKISELTNAVGADAVIITAATHSLEPINFAGQILRKRGTVVVVGSVPTGFDREPYFYKKELTVKMSCSYGPGRYDLGYEEKGVDYPVGYVRWTENRNMQAFQDLLHSGRINIDYLTTHRFKLDDAPKAYDMILQRSEPFLGILIEYDTHKPFSRNPIQITQRQGAAAKEKISIAFVGAGSYAMSHLLPNIPKDERIRMAGVMTSSGTSSRTVSEKYGFEFSASSEEKIFEDPNIDLVFVATRHNSHGNYVKQALENGKHVFVEKPLCLSEQELNEITANYQRAAKSGKQPMLMVGFNRRFSPLIQTLKQQVGEGPMSVIYRINAGQIPADTWIQDKEIGGGRVIGEVCHFVDLMIYLTGSLPDKVFASAMQDAAGLNDTLSINLHFENGSIGTICYFANGSKELFKEYIEVYRAGTTAVLRDFKELEIFGRGKATKKKLLNQDKGQPAMVKAFLEAALSGTATPIPFEEIHATTQATFNILNSLQLNAAMDSATNLTTPWEKQ